MLNSLAIKRTVAQSNTHRGFAATVLLGQCADTGVFFHFYNVLARYYAFILYNDTFPIDEGLSFPL